MAGNGINVGDHVVVDNDVYLVKATDGDLCVLEGVVDEDGGTITGRHAVDRRAAKPKKVNPAFVNALKGTV